MLLSEAKKILKKHGFICEDTDDYDDADLGLNVDPEEYHAQKAKRKLSDKVKNASVFAADKELIEKVKGWCKKHGFAVEDSKYGTPNFIRIIDDTQDTKRWTYDFSVEKSKNALNVYVEYYAVSKKTGSLIDDNNGEDEILNANLEKAFNFVEDVIVLAK